MGGKQASSPEWLASPVLHYFYFENRHVNFVSTKHFERTHGLAPGVRRNLAVASVGNGGGRWGTQGGGRANWGAPIKWQHTKWHGASCQQLSIHPTSKGFAHLNESADRHRGLRARQRRRGEQRRLEIKDERENTKKKKNQVHWANIRYPFNPSTLNTLTSSHLGELSNPVSPVCYITQLTGPSRPQLQSEATSVSMSLASSSTRCSALDRNHPLKVSYFFLLSKIV